MFCAVFAAALLSSSENENPRRAPAQFSLGKQTRFNWDCNNAKLHLLDGESKSMRPVLFISDREDIGVTIDFAIADHLRHKNYDSLNGRTVAGDDGTTLFFTYNPRNDALTVVAKEKSSPRSWEALHCRAKF